MELQSGLDDRCRHVLWRKVRAPEGRVVGNAHRPRGQGQCHRKHTADRSSFGRFEVRVKRCGKSAPADRATGSARQTPPGARPSREKCDTPSRRSDAGRPGPSSLPGRSHRGDGQPSPQRNDRPRQNPAYRPALHSLHHTRHRTPRKSTEISRPQKTGTRMKQLDANLTAPDSLPLPIRPAPRLPHSISVRNRQPVAMFLNRS